MTKRIITAVVRIAAAGGAAFALSGSAGASPMPPVPGVNRPIDSTNGLFGVPRGSIPNVSTPDVSDVAPGVPAVGVGLLPTHAAVPTAQS